MQLPLISTSSHSSTIESVSSSDREDQSLSSRVNSICRTLAPKIEFLTPHMDYRSTLKRTVSHFLNTDLEKKKLGPFKTKNCFPNLFSILGNNGKNAIINLNQPITNLDGKFVNNSFKSLKVAVRITGEMVLVVKPNRKKNSPEVENAWERELDFWRKLIELREKGEDLEGLLVPDEIISLSSRKQRVIIPFRTANCVDYINKFRPLSNGEKMRYIYQTTKALYFVHTKMFLAHRDVKPDNLLCDGNGNIELTDWGFARTLEPKEESFIDGSNGYYPPESKNQSLVDSSAYDAWALGVVIYVIWNEKLPNFAITQINRDIKESYAEMDHFFTLPPKEGDPVADLYSKLLRPADARWEVIQAYQMAKEIIPLEFQTKMAVKEENSAKKSRPSKD